MSTARDPGNQPDDAAFSEVGDEARQLPLSLADRLAIEARDAHAQWITALREMAERAASLAEYRDLVLNAYAELPTDQLTEVMSIAFAVADARGREAVAAEAGLNDAGTE